MALVELNRFYNSFEAATVRSLLESEDIPCVLFDSEMNWGGIGLLIPVRLMVDDSDLEQAQQILKHNIA